jgi:hypothetical protein
MSTITEAQAGTVVIFVGHVGCSDISAATVPESLHVLHLSVHSCSEDIVWSQSLRLWYAARLLSNLNSGYCIRDAGAQTRGDVVLLCWLDRISFFGL